MQCKSLWIKASAKCINVNVNLLQAVMLPSELAVVKVKGHASGDKPDVVGNRNADEMAKWAAEHAEISPYQRAQSRDV